MVSVWVKPRYSWTQNERKTSSPYTLCWYMFAPSHFLVGLGSLNHRSCGLWRCCYFATRRISVRRPCLCFRNCEGSTCRAELNTDQVGGQCQPSQSDGSSDWSFLGARGTRVLTHSHIVAHDQMVEFVHLQVVPILKHWGPGHAMHMSSHVACTSEKP